MCLLLANLVYNITKRRYTQGYRYIQGLKRAIWVVGLFMASLELLEALPEALYSYFNLTKSGPYNGR
jgi:hypothetical protein